MAGASPANVIIAFAWRAANRHEESLVIGAVRQLLRVNCAKQL